MNGFREKEHGRRKDLLLRERGR